MFSVRGRRCYQRYKTISPLYHIRNNNNVAIILHKRYRRLHSASAKKFCPLRRRVEFWKSRYYCFGGIHSQIIAKSVRRVIRFFQSFCRQIGRKKIKTKYTRYKTNRDRGSCRTYSACECDASVSQFRGADFVRNGLATSSIFLIFELTSGLF